jgi:hypothetical protein
MKLFLGLVAVLASTASAHSGARITLARAAELACHRIERIAVPGSTQQIDESYLTHFENLDVEALAQKSPTDPAFRVVARQVPTADKKVSELVLWMEGTKGKTLSVDESFIGQSNTAPVWPNSDPITLSEKALHYVLDNAATKPAVAPFNTDLKRLVISTVKGTPTGAKVTMYSNATTNVLEVLIKFDGKEYKIISADVVKP